MDDLHSFFAELEDLTSVFIRVTSTVSIAIICARIIWDKLTRKK